MRNGGRALLAVLILFVRIEIRVATLDTNHSVADSTQTIAASMQKLSDCSKASQSAQLDIVDVSGETIRLLSSLSLAVDMFTCNLHER